MPMVVGADGTITVPIDADADPAAAEIEDAFSKAIARAMNDPKVKAAIVGLVKTVLTEINKIPKSTDKAWQQSIKQSQRAAKAMADAFKAMGKAATDATKIPSSTNASYNVLQQQIAAMANNMESLANATRIQRDLLVDLARSARTATRSADQQNRDRLQAQAQELRGTIANQQLQAAALRASSTQRIAALTAFSKQALQIERSLTRVFELTWKSAERAVRAFARAASTVLSGLGKTAATVFSGITRTVAAFARGTATAFSGIGRGAASAFGALSRTIASALRRDENAYRTSFAARERTLSSSLARQSAQIQRFQQQTSRGLAGAITGRGALGIGGGLLAGGGLAGLLTSGFERAGAEESLQLQFTTLLQDGARASEMLAQISEFARTTRFDFVEVAGSVAQLTAAFGDADRAFKTVSFLSDVVSLTGGGTQQFAAARLAFSQIAASGRLEGQELNQLLESIPGVPIVRILADKFFGGDEAAFQDARRAGELGGIITSDAFFEAFEAGVTETFPEVEGFAQRAAGTLTGLTANLKENFAIFGAQIIRLAEGPIKAFIGATNDGLAAVGNFVSGVQTELQLTGPKGQETFQEVLVPLTGTLAELRDVLSRVIKSLGILLALKGVVELFKFLGIGVRALLSPMGLLVLAFTAIGAISGKVLDATAGLRDNFRVLGNQILPTVRGFVDLGKALFGFVTGGDGVGGGGVFGTIGEGVRKFVQFIARGLVTIRTFTKLMTDLLNAGRGDIAFDVISGRLKGLTETIAQFLGAGIFDTTLARLQGGNDFLNILETTFLGPIVRFFRGPFADAIEGLGGFIADLFNAIFGGGEGGIGTKTGAQTPLEQLLGKIIPATDAQDSIGTRILDVLENTFLGPIVRFFRGPFADLVETIGGGVADFGGFVGDIFNAIFGDDPGGTGTRIADVLEDTFLGPVVRFFRGPFADGVESVASFITDTFQSIVDAFQSIGTLIEPFTDAVGNAIRDLFTDDPEKTMRGEGGFGSIWTGLTTSLGNIGERVGEILSPIWTAIKEWFTDTFSAANVIGIAKDVGNVIREVGRVLGLLVSEPVFIIALVGLAVAMIAAIGAALIGVFQGVAENADDWAAILGPAIGDGIKGGIEWVGDNIGDLPSLLGDIIGGLFGNAETTLLIVAAGAILGPAIFKAITAGFSRTTGSVGGMKITSGGGIGAALTGLATGIFAAFSGILIGVFKGFGSLGGMIFGGAKRLVGGDPAGRAAGTNVGEGVLSGLRAKLNTVVGRGGALDGLRARMAYGADALRERFGSVGAGIAASVIGGIASFEIGRAAGRSGSTGNILLAILGGGATGALIGSTFGGVGAGIGAAIGVTLAGIGAAIGATGAAAQKAKDEIREYSDALLGIAGDQTPLDVGTTVFLQNLLTELPAVNQFFIDAEFNARAFVQSIIDGTGSGEQALADLMTTFFGTSEAFAALNSEQQNALVGVRNVLEEAAAAGEDLSRGELLSRIGEIPGAFDALVAAGIPISDLFDVLEDEGGELDAALKVMGQNTALQTLATDAEIAAGAVSGVGKGVDTTALTGAIGTVKTPLNELQGAAEDAKRAVSELLSADTYGGSLTALQDELALELPDLNELILRALEGVSPENVLPAIRQAVGPIGDSFGDLLAQAIDEGAVTNGAEFDTFLGDLRTQITDLNLGPEAEAFLLTFIDGLDTPENREAVKAAAAAVLEAAALEASTGVKQLAGDPFGIQAAILDEVEAPAGPIVAAQGFGTRINEEVAVGITESNAIQNALAAATSGNTTKRLGPAPTTQTGGVEIDDSGIADARKLVAGINAILIAGVVRAAQAGVAIGRAITAGIQSGMSGAVSAGAALGLGASLAAGRFAGLAFIAGRNIGQGLASGIASMAQHVANTARLIAQAAINAARATLQSRSPSEVFKNIGRDVGEGFIQGIKDAEGDMITAIGTALENAVSEGAKRASLAIARAQVGQTIFDNLQPGVLPGGATQLDIADTRNALTQSILGFADELRGGAAGTFGDSSNQAFLDARNNLNGLVLDFRLGIEATRNDYNAAQAARRELAAFDDRRAFLDRTRASGALGRAEFSAQLADLNRELSSGALSQAEYAKKLAILNKELANGTLNAEKYAEEIKELGARPAALTITQQDLLASGFNSLNTGTIAGQANAETIGAALGTIREFGAAALEAGSPLANVVAEMTRYTNELRRQALAQGLTAASVDKLIASYGLSGAALAQFQANLTSLNTGTAAGAANVAKITEQLQSIRDYGSELLAAGFSASSVITQLKDFRDKLVDQATAFGFSESSILALVTAAGLSDSALAAFIKQLNDFNTAAAEAASVAEEAARAAREKKAAEDAAAAAAGQGPGVSGNGIDRPVIENVNFDIHLPTGDPEANALAMLNRLNYGLLVR